MTPQIPEDVTVRINTLLDYIGNTASKAEGFATEQAPLIAQEIVRWEIVCGFFFMLPFFLFGGLLFVTLLLFNRWENGPEAEKHFGGLGFFLLLATAVCTLPLISGIFTAAKAYTAPRLVIVEYVKNIAK